MRIIIESSDRKLAISGAWLIALQILLIILKLLGLLTASWAVTLIPVIIYLSITISTRVFKKDCGWD